MTPHIRYRNLERGERVRVGDEMKDLQFPPHTYSRIKEGDPFVGHAIPAYSGVRFRRKMNPSRNK